MEQRHADVPSVGEVLDQVAWPAAVGVVVEDDCGIEADRDRRGVGPGDRRHLLTGLVPDLVERGAQRRVRDRDVPGFVKQVARPFEPVRVEDQAAAADRDAGK
jgi:hypothetical protein